MAADPAVLCLGKEEEEGARGMKGTEVCRQGRSTTRMVYTDEDEDMERHGGGEREK